MLHMEHNDIITKLRTVSQAGRPIRLVIARAVPIESSSGEVLDINDVSIYSNVRTCTCNSYHTVGEWHEMNGRTPLAHGLTIFL